MNKFFTNSHTIFPNGITEMTLNNVILFSCISGINKYRPIWESFDQLGQVQTNLDKFRPIWTSPDQFG